MHDGAAVLEDALGGPDARIWARPWWRPRDRVEWLLAAVAVVAALVVAAQLVTPAMAQRGPGQADLRALATAQLAKGPSVSLANAVESGGPAVDTATGKGPAADSRVGGGSGILSDGSPLPVVVVFNGDTITLTGAVPSQAAAQRLAALAETSSKTPNAKIISRLIVDPRVPDSAGTRVIEMKAARFATGSSEVSPDYAPELSRVVTLLKAMPNLTVLVIGHADQRGDSELNLKLSQARASAVVEHLIVQGISPDRLSARGVGDSSPLTQQSDAAGLALNRRTEFVFFGLMVGA